MAQVILKLELYDECGHPGNLPSKHATLMEITEQMAKLLEKADGRLGRFRLRAVMCDYE
jgi:hypothetical protein